MQPQRTACLALSRHVDSTQCTYIIVNKLLIPDRRQYNVRNGGMSLITEHPSAYVKSASHILIKQPFLPEAFMRHDLCVYNFFKAYAVHSLRAYISMSLTILLKNRPNRRCVLVVQFVQIKRHTVLGKWKNFIVAFGSMYNGTADTNKIPLFIQSLIYQALK